MRAYVYTYVTTYGEESAPSPPTVVTGFADARWYVSLPGSYTGVASPVDRVRVYRTATADNAYTYRMVAELPVETVSMEDTVRDDLLPFQPALPSIDWLPPPQDLRFLHLHGSGALVGVTGRTIRFSEPYQPHAWPPSSAYSVPVPVTALAVFGTSVLIFTRDRPFLLDGVHPSSMALTPLPISVPVETWRAVHTALDAVWVATRNGILRFDGRGFTNVSAPFIRPDQWEAFDPTVFRLTSHRDMLLCRVGTARGLAIMQRGDGLYMTDLPEIARADEQIYDLSTDRTYVRLGNDIYELDAVDTEARRFTWQSQEIVLPAPMSFGVLQVDVRPEGRLPTDPAEPTEPSPPDAS
ncbi:MAG: hypothetical protein Q9Q40_14975, partial [Acidobacteriota bacterium]|nr:hypothetical protein [Acidobacteriota bacterium]